MRRCLVSVQLAVAAWREAVEERIAGNDRGAVTTETVIITALLGGAALALATYIVTAVGGWQDQIPLSGG